jgi:peroxiredoxin
MIQFVRSFSLVCLLVLAALGSTPKVGERAPQFTLTSSNGSTVELKSYAGKKLVLVFYRGYW